MTTADCTVSDIAAMLRRDADALARALLPRGSYQNGRREWVVTGANSPIGAPISVHVGSGPKQGICGFWTDARKGGDMLDLIGMVHGVDSRGAIQEAKRWLGVGALTPRRVDPAAEARREAAQRAEKAGRQDSARRVWEGSTALGGAARTYLVSRGLDPAMADDELRGHVGLRHPEGGSFPALVGRVTIPNGDGGVWRIYVKHDGSGKAPVEAPKLGLGDVRGGAVRIGGVWPQIGIAEGIETALACRQIVWEAKHVLIPVWAALSSGNMRSIELPAGVASVRIFADNDPIKFRPDGTIRESAGMAAASALAARLMAQGIETTIEAPPTDLDWLDVLNATKGKA